MFFKHYIISSTFPTCMQSAITEDCTCNEVLSSMP